MSTRELGLKYLKLKAESDLVKAKLSLDLLLDKGVGVGEHSVKDFHDNLDEALNMIVDAEDRLQVLENIK